MLPKSEPFWKFLISSQFTNKHNHVKLALLLMMVLSNIFLHTPP